MISDNRGDAYDSAYEDGRSHPCTKVFDFLLEGKQKRRGKKSVNEKIHDLKSKGLIQGGGAKAKNRSNRNSSSKRRTKAGKAKGKGKTTGGWGGSGGTRGKFYRKK